MHTMPEGGSTPRTGDVALLTHRGPFVSWEADARLRSDVCCAPPLAMRLFEQEANFERDLELKLEIVGATSNPASMLLDLKP